MEAVARQLVWIRRKGRALLLLQRLSQWGAAVLAIGVMLGLLDFALRFPAWLRVAIALAVGVGALVWLGGRLARAVRFRPTLWELALRAERLFPELHGRLASAVEFAVNRSRYRNPERTGALSSASVAQVEAALRKAPLGRLIDPTRTLRALALLVVAGLTLGAFVLAMPDGTKTAAQRWLTPWTGVEWPLRTWVTDRTQRQVWPADAPVRLEAGVERGYSQGMRVWVAYQFVGPEGEGEGWRHQLMAEQPAEGEFGRFESLVELPDHLLAGAGEDTARLVYRLSAGDHATSQRQVELVNRPRVEAVRATIDPPAYAEGLQSTQQAELHTQGSEVATASALRGSNTRLSLRFNKPVPVESWRDVLPGLPEEAELIDLHEGEGGLAEGMTVGLVLMQSAQSAVELVDEHGLSGLGRQQYRLEAIEDEPPTVSLLRPERDEAVLPSAVIELEGRARDDVGMAELSIETELHRADADPEASPALQRLARETGRAGTMQVRHRQPLEELALRPGDTLTVFALGRDVFELEGERHEPVQSVQRHLRVIEESELVEELRGELANVRQQAIRLEQQQRRLAGGEAEQVRGEQRRLQERLERQRERVEALDERADRNRLEEPAMLELLERSGALAERAEQAGAEAMAGLDEGEDAAEAQEQVREALQELIELLDQGRDALTLQLLLRQLQTQQERLSSRTEELLPQTAGERLADLPAELREALDEAAARQADRAGEASELMQRMRSAARALAEHGQSDRDEALAETLSEAAETAEAEGLDEWLEDAAESLEENRLSEAGRQQSEALDVMERMLRAMGDAERRMQALLQRRLAELAERLEELIERQQAKGERIGEADDLAGLERRQAELRRQTMATEQAADEAEETREVAAVIGQAVSAQADAVRGMRGGDRDAAALGSSEAVARLEAALERIEQQEEDLAREALEEERDELRELYLELAGAQADLAERVSALAERGELDRRGRREAIELGQSQAALGERIAEAGERTEEVLLFEHLHARMVRSVGRVTGLLEAAEATPAVVSQQDGIEHMLRTLASVLEDEDGEGSDFAGELADGAEGGGGGAGGDELVPPEAELRLLRDLQRWIRQRTEADAPGELLSELGEEQGELAEIGQRLIERMQEQMEAMEQRE